MKKRAILAYSLGTILSIAFLLYLLVELDWATLRTAFSQVHWGWLGLGILAYFANILLRALRFRYLIYSRPVQWIHLVSISALHNMFMYLMPAKTGDVAYILLAKDRLRIPLTEGTATLLAARFYDFGIVAVILAITLSFAETDIPAWILRSSLIFCVLVLMSVVAVFLFLKLSKPGSRRNPSASPFLSRVLYIWDELTTGLRQIQANRTGLRVATITLGIWIFLFADYFFITQSLGTPLTFFHISIIAMVMVPLTLFPLQGFANIGTHEVGWVSVLLAFGYSYDVALVIAVGSHFVLLVSVLLAGGFGLGLRKVLSSRSGEGDAF